MKTSEILGAAAGVTERNGFVQENFYKAHLGPQGRELKDPRECEVCPRGAIAVAVGRHPMFEADWPEYCEWHVIVDLEQRAAVKAAEEADHAAIVAAEEALSRYLLERLDHPPTIHRSMIEDWADRPGRTQEQVLAALRECARAEQEAGR